MKKYFLLFLLMTASISNAWADDAVEAAATGNIVFEKAPELTMQDETLTITKSANKKSEDEKFSIDVDFHFKNNSTHDVTRKIAFVLPPVQCRESINSEWKGLESGFKDFTTTVDNKPITFTTRTEAYFNKRNITTLLTQAGIPLNPCQIHIGNDGKADPKYRDTLIKNHLLNPIDDTLWAEHIYFEWTQTFPAGKTIQIHHHYTPVIGGSVLAPRSAKELNEQFSFDKPAVKKLIWSQSPETISRTHPNLIDTLSEGSKNIQRFNVVPKWVRYQLTTGAYWNGGIKLFKLIIKDEAGAPFGINEFYNKNNATVKSITKDTMSFTIKNFVPKQNLSVLFLYLPPNSEGSLIRTF